MKKRFAKITAAVLAMAMVLTMTACGGTTAAPAAALCPLSPKLSRASGRRGGHDLHHAHAPRRRQAAAGKNIRQTAARSPAGLAGRGETP